MKTSKKKSSGMSIEQRICGFEQKNKAIEEEACKLRQERLSIMTDFLKQENMDGYVRRKSDSKVGKFTVLWNRIEFYPVTKSGALSKNQSTAGLPYISDLSMKYLEKICENFEPVTDYKEVKGNE